MCIGLIAFYRLAVIGTIGKRLLSVVIFKMVVRVWTHATVSWLVSEVRTELRPKWG